MDDNKNTLDPELGILEGMAIYERIVNNVDDCTTTIDNDLMELRRVDSTGQFLSSTARFLAAIDKDKFADLLPSIIEAAIEKDRERRYIGELLESIWGVDYKEHIEDLKESDNVFRRLYKRVFPSGTFDI